MELDIQLYDLKEVIHEAISIVKYNALTKGLDLRTELMNQLPSYVYIDSIRLKQVLVNLLNNAIKFTENGYVMFHLEETFRDEEHQQVNPFI